MLLFGFAFIKSWRESLKLILGNYFGDTAIVLSICGNPVIQAACTYATGDVRHTKNEHTVLQVLWWIVFHQNLEDIWTSERNTSDPQIYQ